MDKEIKQLNGCPEFEELSAYFDGEIADDSALAGHVLKCENCRKALKMMEDIALMLKKRDSEFANETVLNSVKQGVYRKIEQLEAKPPLRFPKFIMQIAAAAVIGSGVIYIAVNGLSNPPEKISNPTITQPAPISDKTNPDNYPYYASSDSGSMGGALFENSIPLQNLVGAGFGDSDPVFGAGKTDKNSPTPAVIADSVRHVWVVKSLTGLQNELKKLFQQSGIALDKMSSNVSGNAVNIHASITKLELVKLVKLCKANGFELLNSQVPQPEQNIFEGQAGDPVTYTAQFMINKPYAH